eukprot:6936064-Alexandrium_andersonii.AAC.1
MNRGHSHQASFLFLGRITRWPRTVAPTAAGSRHWFAPALDVKGWTFHPGRLAHWGGVCINRNNSAFAK